jgi:ABC-type Fe3+/spermidine/putrescine transport system ATPase subunit
VASGDPILAIEIVEARKSYGEVQALRGVSLGVKKGQFLTLLGPSGSGKTTLLHAIAGFQQLDSGSVIAGGTDVTRRPAHRRGFGLVFQHYALFPHMTVRDNIAYPLRTRGDRADDRKRLVDEYLELVELAGLSERYPEQLSGGQRQRVALARALVFGPPLLLMDEPLGALDRRLRHSIQFRIKRIQQELGATVIHVTHDQEEALAMSDVIAILRDGVVEQVGTPRELYLHPANAFVAGFMGETNRLEVTAVPSGSGTQLTHSASGQTFRLPLGGSTHAGQAVLCVRPEHVRLVPSQGHLAGTLSTRTFMGDHWRYDIQIGAARLVVKEPEGGAPPQETNGPVSVAFDAAKVQLFSADLARNEHVLEDAIN